MKKAQAGSVAGVIAIGAAAWAIRDYTKWRSLGPGGLPANVGGWLSMTRFRMMARDGLDVMPILAARSAVGDLQAWVPVPRTAGSRPAVSPYPIPHRQLNQLPDHLVRVQLAALFERTVDRHSDKLKYALSHFEKRHPAITLKSAHGTVGAQAHGEIAHIHPSDSSMHMILSPTDSLAAIDAGWAQRHGLAGIALGLPVTYVMVYAPRTVEDLPVVADMLEAAIAYAIQPAL